VVRYGDAPEVTQAYLAYHEEKSQGRKDPIPRAVAAAAGVYAVQTLTLEPSAALVHGEALRVQGEVYSPDGRAPVVLIGLIRADGTAVYGVATDMDRAAPEQVAPDRFRFSVEFDALPLLPGKYYVRAHALDPEGVRLFDNVELPFTVSGTTRELGLVRLPHRWNAASARRAEGEHPSRHAQVDP
jgi:lipopolysaccharide transport system ATP-binding protein